MTAQAAADWSRYWRSADEPLEAMHARFHGNVYHRHSHDTYSFGVTEWGAQSFTCRHAAHTSAAGMVMAFNPDDPHDGHAATDDGFSYRMIHIGPGAGDRRAVGHHRPSGRAAAVRPPGAARSRAGPGAAPAARRADRAGQPAGARRAADRGHRGRGPVRGALPAGPGRGRPRGFAEDRTARLVRDFLDAHYAAPVTGDELAAAAGRSRYAAYRAFRAAWGLAPSEYQRLLRLRAARQCLAAGVPPAEAAAAAGFADQAHLTRWFRRCYGITPAEFRRAAA